jgi:hypothetical protein
VPNVLLIPPMKSPTTGRLLGWSMSHTLDCWLPAARMRHHPEYQYVQMPASKVSAHVGSCSHCGGGR